jgi:hypothetical protein
MSHKSKMLWAKYNHRGLPRPQAGLRPNSATLLVRQDVAEEDPSQPVPAGERYVLYDNHEVVVACLTHKAMVALLAAAPVSRDHQGRPYKVLAITRKEPTQ